MSLQKLVDTIVDTHRLSEIRRRLDYPKALNLSNPKSYLWAVLRQSVELTLGACPECERRRESTEHLTLRFMLELDDDQRTAEELVGFDLQRFDGGQRELKPLKDYWGFRRTTPSGDEVHWYLRPCPACSLIGVFDAGVVQSYSNPEEASRNADALDRHWKRGVERRKARHVVEVQDKIDDAGRALDPWTPDDPHLPRPVQYAVRRFITTLRPQQHFSIVTAWAFVRRFTVHFAGAPSQYYPADQAEREVLERVQVWADERQAEGDPRGVAVALSLAGKLKQEHVAGLPGFAKLLESTE